MIRGEDNIVWAEAGPAGEVDGTGLLRAAGPAAEVDGIGFLRTAAGFLQRKDPLFPAPAIRN